LAVHLPTFAGASPPAYQPAKPIDRFLILALMG
jgi:hypothetical protein